MLERALRRLETALAEVSGEPVLRVVREAPEVSLEEFLAQARMATLWGDRQLLILRRADTYPAEALSAVTDYLRHPAPRSLVILTAPSLKAKAVEKHAVFGRLQKDQAALEFPTFGMPTCFPGWPRRPGVWARPCRRPRPSDWWRWWGQPPGA